MSANTLVMTAAQLADIVAHGEAAAPEEACGLLVGRREGAEVRVTAVRQARNLAADPARTFEVDPAVRLEVQRRVRGTAEDLVGHYHSHPNGLDRPSETDVAMALEGDLVWLILPLADGRAGRPRAYLIEPESRSVTPVDLHVAGAATGAAPP